MDDADPDVGAGPGPDVDRLLTDLGVWAGDERVRMAAQSRARRRSLRQQATEAATFVGALIDLAERATPVTVRTTAGTTHHGRLLAVGRDFAALHTTGSDGGGGVVLVVLHAIASVRTDVESRAATPTGDRAPARPVTLAQALSALAAVRPAVRVVARGGEAVQGELLAVGEDLMTVGVDGRPARHVYFALASVEECTVFGSG